MTGSLAESKMRWSLGSLRALRTTLVENVVLPNPFLAMKLRPLTKCLPFARARLYQVEIQNYACMRVRPSELAAACHDDDLISEVDLLGCKRADTLGLDSLTIPLETNFAPYSHVLFFMASYLQEQSTPTAFLLPDGDGRVTNLAFIDQDTAPPKWHENASVSIVRTSIKRKWVAL